MITPKLTEGTFRRFEERRIQYINHGSIGRNVPITTLYRRMPVQFPNTQALNCKTFRPPIDILQQQSLSIPELYEWNAENNPDHPLFVYHDGEELQSILWPDALRAIRRAAHVVASGVKGAATPAGRPPVIAIFATTGTSFCHVSRSRISELLSHRDDHVFLSHRWHALCWLYRLPDIDT